MRRWAVLAAYALLAAMTQLLWLTFAPITTQAARDMGVDAGLAGDLAVIFPFVYILLAMPAGWWLDHRFRPALGAGAALTAGGAALRLLAPGSFSVQLAGQLVIAAGQPLVLNSITKIAARYFAPQERATAISVGSVALFVGILAAVLAGGPLYAAGGLRLVLWAEAAPALAALPLVVLALRVRPEYSDDAPAGVSLRWLWHDRFMWLLAGLVFIGMGTYNAVATWLQPILDSWKQGAAAGDLVAVMTFAGIVGAGVLPPLVAARDRRRPLLVTTLAVSAIAFLSIALRHDPISVGTALFVDGFVLMASLPVVLDWADVHGGPERQGAAVGFLMLAGNLGGVVLALAVQGLVFSPYLALAALSAVALLGLPLALALPARAAAAARA